MGTFKRLGVGQIVLSTCGVAYVSDPGLTGIVEHDVFELSRVIQSEHLCNRAQVFEGVK